MSAAPNRRTLLGAALIAPAAIAVPSCSVAASSGLLAKMRVRAEAEAAWDAYREQAFNPMEEALYAARKLIPHERTTLTYRSIGGDATFSTESWSLGMARRAIEDANFVQEDHLAAAKQAVELAEARDAQLEEVSLRVNEDGIRERERELMDADTDAICVVLAHEAVSVHDLLLKLRFIGDAEVWELPEAKKGVLADAARLSGELR